jgi:hypothetical protein
VHYAPFTCQRCGELFLGAAYRRTCSTCRTAAQDETMSKSNARHSARRSQERSARRASMICRHCGQPLDAARSTRAFCSNACHQAAYREAQPQDPASAPSWLTPSVRRDGFQ